MRIVKKYCNNTGRKFAAVEEASVVGQRRVDILVRGPKDGSTANAFGDFYPTEETRAAQIYEEAKKEFDGSRLNIGPYHK